MKPISRVFIIGWDGAGSFVASANTPNLDRCVRNGTFDFQAQAATPTISAQCWGTLLHGVSPDKHGLTNEIVSHTPYPDGSPYPSIFRVVREAYPDAAMASFSAWYPINHGIIEPSIGVHKVSMKDRDLSLAAAAYIREHPEVKLLFVQFDLPDAAGHQYGYNTPGQLQAIEETDGLTGHILEAIEETGLLDDSLLVFVSDHGGGGANPRGHGSDHPMDKTIYWGCVGPGIPRGAAIPGTMSIVDTAAVVVRALGIEPPESWESKLPERLFAE
ncbi:alkaline phosphatase family protein [Paenibacillus flagellatus]|uniref:Nucleotide pyrophosphatase n=1 Tax=Paenibacillus flagellatus TaxID=2211139 RepID=A0A2V5K8J5_9BACL|nr:alkaline phosphatase family protein [Paenibacillus flagellatus]PYI55708.1 nucleotide pyrophosphatase [Paenibacillus flagellatus]